MIEKAQTANVLARLRQVEADMSDATVIADAKRYRETVRGVFTRDDAAIMLGVARQALWAHHNPALEGRTPSFS